MTRWRQEPRSVFSPASKVCSRCGIEKPAADFSPRPERPIGLAPCCKRCKAEYRSERYAALKRDDPIERWARIARAGARSRANRDNLAFNLTTKQLVELAKNQGEICIYCSCDLNFRGERRGDRKQTASLDKIKPKVGYIVSNVVVACYRCNAIKHDAQPAELRQIADRLEELLCRS